ncbi:integrase catalytic domain-containing protein [Trichonephila clavipes]|nr:integrase catalytic domain-containing protein [Trichonephila clavipes]
MSDGIPLAKAFSSERCTGFSKARFQGWRLTMRQGTLSSRCISQSCNHVNHFTYASAIRVQSANSKMYANSTQIRSDQIRTQLSIKLPEIPLPKFSGKYEERSNFKIQFKNMISTNLQLSSEQKLHYLKAAFTSEAKNLETISDSFESLFKSLEERYENKRLIVKTHVKAILNLAKLKNESAKDLRYLIDDVNKNMRALKVLEFKRNNLSDILILKIILQKLDKETLKQFEYSLNSTEVPKFDDFILFLEKRAQVL